MANVLLINPSYQPSYAGARAGIVNPVHPTLGLATIAAVARERGHNIKILDMSWRSYDWPLIKQTIEEQQTDIVGITATTPLVNQLRDISVMAKDISEDITVVGGGPHPSALPVETILESRLDMVLAGEADYSFADICDGMSPADVKGIYYRSGDEVLFSGMRPPIENLDDLPMPAWDLYDTEDYKQMSRLLCRRPPITMAEFSRGCVFTCDFCASKITMARGYRKKSPERCADEAEQMYKLGFREFMLSDDIFTSDQKWAVEVSEAISRRNIDIVWSCTNGIRVESANAELFEKMRAAGCYRVSFGFESGNDEVLKAFGKGGRASIEQGRKAVRQARKAGLDTNGFFLIGLSPDTESSMRDTIEFARHLPVDLIRFAVTVAFPGTAMFNNYARKGLIQSYNWDDYFTFSPKALFTHEHLTIEQIQTYLKIAYRRTILFNPGFIVRRLLRGVRTGEFFWDLYYGVRFYFMPAAGKEQHLGYYARDRWPHFEFEASKLQPAAYQVVKKPAAQPAGNLAAAPATQAVQG